MQSLTSVFKSLLSLACTLSPLLIVGIIFVIILVVILVLINKKHKKSEYYQQTHKSIFDLSVDKGSMGEYQISKSLDMITGYNKKIYNCYIPKDDGTTTEIDVIMIHEKGVYVFESKNYNGWIFGTETQQYWTQSLKAGNGQSQKFQFFNPIMQNETHVNWLGKYLSELRRDIVFYSCIVFGNSCELKNITLTSDRHVVVNELNLYDLVQNHLNSSHSIYSTSDVDEIYNKLYPLTQKSDVEKMMHIYNVEKIKSQNVESTSYNRVNTQNYQYQANEVKAEHDKYCKKCGAKMVLRTVRSGENMGNQFWGCANYPECRYTEKI